MESKLRPQFNEGLEGAACSLSVLIHLVERSLIIARAASTVFTSALWMTGDPQTRTRFNIFGYAGGALKPIISNARKAGAY
jgi:hypothetical protein